MQQATSVLDGPASAPAVASAPILRVDTASLAQVLERFQDPALLAEGRINVMALDAISSRLGSRWALRRDLVYDHVQHTVERHLGPEAVCLRIAETLFAVVQPGAPRLMAQALCLRCLRDIHNHFLGQAEVSDIALHEVTRITGDGVFGQRVDVVAAAAAEASIPAAATGPRAVADAPEPKRRLLDQWTPFVAADGRTVRVSCTLEPIIHLSASTRIGYRLGRRVIELPSEKPLTLAEQQRLSGADIARIDYATLTRGLDRLGTEVGEGRSPVLIVRVSYVTLSNQRTREVFVRLLEDAKSQVRHGLVCEICDIEGVPASALLTVVSLMKPFCVRVIASVAQFGPGLSRSLAEVRFHGIAAECPSGLGDAEFIGWLNQVRRTTPAGATVFACRLEGTRRPAMAAVAGMTHATLISEPRKLVV